MSHFSSLARPWWGIFDIRSRYMLFFAHFQVWSTNLSTLSTFKSAVAQDATASPVVMDIWRLKHPRARSVVFSSHSPVSIGPHVQTIRSALLARTDLVVELKRQMPQDVKENISLIFGVFLFFFDLISNLIKVTTYSSSDAKIFILAMLPSSAWNSRRSEGDRVCGDLFQL